MPLPQQKQEIFSLLGYTPSTEQSLMHFALDRFKLVSGGERSGKSYASAMEYLGRFWETPLLWLVAADYNRTRAEFDYICEGFDKLGIPYFASKQVDPGIIETAGGFIVETKSATDPRKLAMTAPDGIIVCEASQIDFETFLRVRGRLAEKRGWLLMSGTFESSLGWYPEMFTRWQLPNADEGKSFSLPTWSNRVIFPGGRDDPEIKRLEATVSPEWFMERFGGVPCPPKGRVFHEFSNPMHTGQGGKFEFDPASEVRLWVDPGYASAYAVEVAQIRGDDVYIIDEIFERGLITSDIIKIAKQRDWWNKVTGGAIDIAARQHQATVPVARIWLDEAGVALRSQKLEIRDGIEAVKRFLIINPITNSPRIHINTRCKGLISEMGGCENPVTKQTAVYQWKQDKEGNIVGETPEDRNNHASKAIAYGLVDSFGFANPRRKAPIKFF